MSDISNCLDFPELLQLILNEYALPQFGTHGVTHWARVWENGERVAARSGAKIDVVRLFAIFHDSRRINEGNDPGHGLRGARFAESLRGKAFDLSDADFKLLYTACEFHTDGKTLADVTVQTCWDADRLDLGRVGMRPYPKYLCTDVAKEDETIEWAFVRGTHEFVPADVLKQRQIQPPMSDQSSEITNPKRETDVSVIFSFRRTEPNPPELRRAICRLRHALFSGGARQNR